MENGISITIKIGLMTFRLMVWLDPRAGLGVRDSSTPTKGLKTALLNTLQNYNGSPRGD